MSVNNFNILIGVTGSVATIKLPLLVKSLLDLNKTGQGYHFEVNPMFIYIPWPLDF